MRKMRFYIMFSDELDRPFTSFKQFTDMRTFSIMDNDGYGDKFPNLNKITLFKSTEDAQEEKDHMLDYMKRDRDSAGKGAYQSFGFKDGDFDVIENLKIVEFNSI